MEHRPALVFAGGVALLTLAGSLAIGATEGLLGFGNPKQPERAGTLAQSLLDGSGVPAIGPRDTTAANTVWAAGRPVALVTAMAPAQAMNALTAGPGLVGPLLPALQLQLGGGQPALLGAPADAFGPPGSMSPGQPAPWPGASLMGPTLQPSSPADPSAPQSSSSAQSSPSPGGLPLPGFQPSQPASPVFPSQASLAASPPPGTSGTAASSTPPPGNSSNSSSSTGSTPSTTTPRTTTTTPPHTTTTTAPTTTTTILPQLPPVTLPPVTLPPTTTTTTPPATTTTAPTTTTTILPQLPTVTVPQVSPTSSLPPSVSGAGGGPTPAGSELSRVI